MENIATGGKHGDPTNHHKWQDNRKSGRKSKQFCEIWQVTGIYIKWHEKINARKICASERVPGPAKYGQCK